MKGDHVTVSIPRSALTIVEAPPALLSQANTGHVAMTRRQYLEAVRDFERAGGEVISRGKARLVDREAFVSWLRRASRAPARAANDVADPVSDLESELGLRRVAR